MFELLIQWYCRNNHIFIEATAFLAASSRSLAVRIGKPDSAKIFFASDTFVPGAQ